MGEQRVKWFIDNDKPFFSRLLQDPNLPEEWRQGLKKVPQYAWAADMLTYEDVMGFLPEWFGGLVVSNPNGEQWFTREVETLKGVLFGGDK